jgi:hypothetical protein
MSVVILATLTELPFSLITHHNIFEKKCVVCVCGSTNFYKRCTYWHLLLYYSVLVL